MTSIKQLTAYSALVLGVAVTSTGCRFDGINSIPLPGNAVGGDTYQVTVELADVQNLVGNSPVKANNVIVGNIARIGGQDWIAHLTLELQDNAEIAANVTAKLAQNSVLGSQYLELTVPAGEEPRGTLQDGAVIPLSRTSQYASTEEVLSALSLVLNGSGLQQIRTVTSELVRVLDGREQNLHELFGNLETLMGGLDQQRADIVRAIDGLDRLGAELATQSGTLDRGIETITPAMGVLNDQQQQLTTMLTSVGEFGQVATEVLYSSREDLHANLTALQPTLSQLASVGDSIPEALKIATTLPFPIETTDRAARGDYVNLFLTLDVSAETVGGKVLGSIPVSELAGLNPARQAANPLLAPTEPRQATLPATPAAGTPQQQGGQR
ncbi:MCE family protein [Rhodococcus ruber]|uniref:Putative Mce family protein n=1 Tax=Rhodococcus ruber TaxID=1830 RepID=A0A098BEH2_9NOCA|nr:MCE family protein [Rhodococcus ruber]MCD2129970.1 MCE family protein [Rhodococcus ruber]MCZ4506441.1 MCE family protein [Rhodococcus ruber]MCZ4533604.1 MCE family protein [Rhodococcus ruber]MCZ4623910.1 MCE family protein [Rhodococcus ruber]MDI9971650.1 MCE family protein [Rhodococcus ruber]